MNINIIIILFFIINKQYVQSSLLDYVLSFGSETENKKNVDINNGVIDQNIPYEVATIDEKFINEAAQLTGLALSELDSCQHRVNFFFPILSFLRLYFGSFIGSFKTSN